MIGADRYPTNLAALAMSAEAEAAQAALDMAHKRANAAGKAFILLARMTAAEESRNYQKLHEIAEQARRLLSEIGGAA